MKVDKVLAEIKEAVKKSMAYDELNRKFQLITNKSADEVLQRLAQTGLPSTDVGNVEYNHKVVKVPEMIANFIGDYDAEFMDGYGSSDSLLEIVLGDWKSGYSEEYTQERHWISNNLCKFIDAVRFDYEVEEEPKYYVVLPSGQHLTKDSKANEYLFVFDAGQAVELTEDEIKGISKDYQPFAVPVEGVNHE